MALGGGGVGHTVLVPDSWGADGSNCTAVADVDGDDEAGTGTGAGNGTGTGAGSGIGATDRPFPGSLGSNG